MSPALPLFGLDLTPHYGLIRVLGEDSETFLQGQLTVDMREITPLQHRLGALCNNKGRIRALFRIFKFQNAYLLQLPSMVLPHALAILKKFAKFSKVTVEDASLEWQRFGIWMNSKFLDPLATFRNGEVRLDSNNVMLSLSDQHTRIELFCPTTSVQPLRKHFDNLQVIQDFEAWKLLDINAGIPEIWPETIEQILPHDINLPAIGAVSFTKGCYCGQEIVARMEYRANLKRKMTHLTLTNTTKLPIPGTHLSLSDNPEATGMVVSAAFSSPNTVEALMVLSSIP